MTNEQAQWLKFVRGAWKCWRRRRWSDGVKSPNEQFGAVSTFRCVFWLISCDSLRWLKIRVEREPRARLFFLSFSIWKLLWILRIKPMFFEICFERSQAALIIVFWSMSSCHRTTWWYSAAVKRKTHPDMGHWIMHRQRRKFKAVAHQLWITMVCDWR